MSYEAILGAGATMAAAAIAAWMVAWQIGRQAKDAINQNRANEGHKLKLQIYESTLARSAAASDAVIHLSTLIRIFETVAKACSEMRRDGISYSPPNANVPKYIKLHGDATEKIIDIIGLVESWRIIDPRISVFRDAFGSALYDLELAHQPYFQVAIKTMPFPPAPEGTKNPVWIPPDDQILQELEKMGASMQDALGDLGAYIEDFKSEMQNLLVGELFGHHIPPRTPIDPDAKVISLGRHTELTTYFQTDTPSGRHHTELTNSLKASAAAAAASNQRRQR